MSELKPTPIEPRKLQRLQRVPVDDGQRIYAVDGSPGLSYAAAYDHLLASTYLDEQKRRVFPSHVMPRILRLNAMHLARVSIRRLLYAKANERQSDAHDEPFSFEPEPASTHVQSTSDLQISADGSPAPTEQTPSSDEV